MKIFEQLQNEQLVWLPEIGVGYYPVNCDVYDEGYFQRYVEMDKTPESDILTCKRLNFVSECDPRKTLDVGIGGGRFVREFDCYGYDVNELAMGYLVSIGKEGFPNETWETMTFWDSLEHISDPSDILAAVWKNVFVSMPIYRDANHILSSKHYRKDEHFWYFTDFGLKYFMGLFGFECVSQNRQEQPLREDIGSYHFIRVKQ